MIVAPPLLEPLPWDSNFLALPVARLLTTGLAPADLAAALAAARQSGVRLLYLIAAPDDAGVAAVARSAGAWLADRKVTFSMPLAAAPSASAPTGAISATTTYTPQLESLAWQSGEYSRFRLDPHLDPAVFQRMYSLWLRNSLAGELARQVLVWHNAEGQELGLLTLGEKGGRADIGLLAVDSTARGQRVGQQLVAAAVAQAIAWGHTELQVVTQRANELACSFYQKCGFKPVHEAHIYHLWFDEVK
jgi:dTDP-4-amino-4,6-dideoxy-D-galactose acyltransferase